MEQNLTGYPSIDKPHEKNARYFEKNPIIPSIDLITILKLMSRKNRNLPAIDCNNLHATYQQLIDDSHTLYLAFKKLGVKKKDIVVLSLPSNYQAITSFFALNELGAVTTFIDTYSGQEDVLNYLKMYRAPLLINFDKSKEENEELVRKSQVKNIITLDKNRVDLREITLECSSGAEEVCINFHALGSIAKTQKDSIHLPNKGNDDALILYTSGSTGQPKAVVLTNKNILAAQIYTGNSSRVENITGTKTMSCVPLRYPYGMVTSLLASLLWGKEAILASDWNTDTVAYYYQKNPNIVFGSPAILELTMKYVPKDMDLSQISHFISGGDFLTIEHAKRGYEFFAKHNNATIELGNGCGNAETVSVGCNPVGVPLKQSTAGKILVGSTPMVIDKEISDNVPIKNGNSLQEKKYYEIGELCLAGSYVFKEYFGEPDKTACAKFIRNGKTFFRTGTLGFIDEDGYFTPTDRKSRFFINSTANKVYLDNVQRIIGMADCRIADCAAVKQPDENELFVVKAFVVLEEGVEPTEEIKKEIAEKLQGPISANGKTEQLKKYEIPAVIEFIERLPRVAGTEKVDYKALEEK